MTQVVKVLPEVHLAIEEWLNSTWAAKKKEVETLEEERATRIKRRHERALEDKIAKVEIVSTDSTTLPYSA